MVITLSSDAIMPSNGIRSIDVRRDLMPVAELIGEAFAGELDAAGRASLREMQLLARLGPLLYLLVPTSGDLGGFFSGYVWEIDGRVVGNVTLQQADSYGRRWIIANVAVRSEYRGQGIARSLMERALQYIAQRGGEWAVLQVRQDNQVARGLYDRLGFAPVLTETYLRAHAVPRQETHSLPGDLTLRPLRASDAQAISNLLRQGLPDLARWWHPGRNKSFHRQADLPILVSVFRLFGSRHRQRLGAFMGRDLAGVLDIDIQPRGEHHLDVLLHPQARQNWTEPLLHFGLQQLQSFSRRPVSALLYDYQPLAIEALIHVGFRPTNTLITMRRRVPLMA